MIYGIEKIRERKELYTLVTHDIVEDADVCVIGSGAAGSIIASKLALAGKSVVLLEKGGYYDAEDMNQVEMEMMPLLWKNGGSNFTENLRMVIAQGECLGGSTVINDAVCFKTPPLVRDQWREMGVDIPDTVWDKALDEVWTNLSVSKVQPYELNENNLKLKQACELRGLKAWPNDRNCIQCRQCGFCHIGCHYETKQDMRVTYLRKALRDSNLRVYCNCPTDRITYDGGAVDGVEGDFVDRKKSEILYKIRVNAKVVVVAAGAIASSQILLKNAIATKTAGTGLSFHPASFLLGKFDEPVNAYNGIPMAYTCHEFGVTNGVKDGAFLIESIFMPIFQFSLSLPDFAESGQLYMNDFIYYSMAGVMVRDQPVGKVTISGLNGTPRVKYNPAPQDIDTFAKGLQLLAEMWFDIGAREVISGHADIARLGSKDDIPKLVQAVKNNPDHLQFASAHPQGGNRMGSDPATSVVDSNRKVHGFENLFVCDASVFPTAVGVNPQVTVMSLATMTADHIISNWKDFAQIPMEERLGETCSLMQPMWCSTERLETMYDREANKFPIETLVNAGDASGSTAGKPDSDVWSFDKEKLMIYNNKYWKGFFTTDQDVAALDERYFAGFWKRFFIKDGVLQGVTHPYAAAVFADNVPEMMRHKRYGDVLHLRYTGAEFAMFYDLLKIIDKDTILGKAFLGFPPNGTQLLVFSMSRRYDINFMTEEDHERIFSDFATAPTFDQVEGRWVGKLVSDSTLTPNVWTFDYDKDNFGNLEMKYVFGGFLDGISRVVIKTGQMEMYDFTNWHDEVKFVSNKLLIGKWCSPEFDGNLLPSNFDFNFLSVDSIGSGSIKIRLCLRYILSRN